MTSFAAVSMMFLRLVRSKFSPFALALFAVLLPTQAYAACSTSGSLTTCTSSGGITVNGAVGVSEGNSISVSSLPGTVSNINITLTGLNVTGSNGGGLNSVAIALVDPSGKALDIASGICNEASSTFTFSDSGDTGTNNENGMLPALGEGTCSGLSGTYFPSDYYPAEDTFNSPGPSTYDSGGNTLDGTGGFNLSSAFGLPASAASMDGTWTLYIATQVAGEYIPSGSLSSWSIAFTTETATATTTSISANPTGLSSNVFTSANGAATPVTLTATISPSPSSGTVTFYDSTGTTAGLGTVVASGVGVSGSQASTTVTFPAAEEGSRSISAVFSGTSNYASSTSGTATVLTVNHPSNPSGTTYCNGPVKVNDNPSNIGGTGGYPYPSQLILSGVPGTIEAVTVTLNGLQVEDPDFTGLMLQAPNGNGYEFMSWADGNGPGGDPASLTNTTVWLADGGSGLLQTNSEGTDSQQSCTSGSPCKPADDYVQLDPLFNDTFPSAGSPFTDPSSVGKAYPTGSATFTSQFGGAAANGTWLLYLNDWLSENPSSNSSLPYGQITSWCLNFTMQTNADATSTTVSASPNPATIASGTTTSVTFTATVADTSDSSNTVNAGSVTFVDGATTLGTGTVSNGTASVSASLTEGTHQVVASYSGTNSGSPEFGISNGTIDLRVNKATSSSGSGAGPYSFCNSGSIVAPAPNYDYGAGSPYPSNVSVTSLPGTVKATSVTLNDFTTRDQGDLMSLLVGPGGNNLDFFSLTGSNVGTAPAAFNLTFQDGGSAIGGNLSGGGPYEPSSKNTSIAYPQCAQNATLCGTQNVGPPLGASSTFTPTNKATNAGSAIFGNASSAGVFGGGTGSTYNGNGTWSLYMDDGGPTGEGEATSISGGWCVNLTVNQPVISTPALVHSGVFWQGKSNAQYTVDMTNNGPGSTGDPSGLSPMTVTDTLNAAFTLPSGSGLGWTCSATGQTLTCKNDTVIPEGSPYPELTINVNVLGTATGNVNNQITASGAGVSATLSNTDAVTIEVPPAFTSGASTTFTVGTAGAFTATATGTPAPTFSESGALPTGVTITDTGTISGTPADGTGGSYPITITAANGTVDANQSFTLTVNQVPAITSAASATFTSGSAGLFTVTTTGYPAAAFTVAGVLPGGVTLIDNGNGTATLSGTPSASAGGVYPITITAANGVSPNAMQSFTLTVNQAPAITSASSTTFTMGSAGTFTVTASSYPSATFSETGALPSGVTFTIGGTLSGTPAIGTWGTYPITITATNGISPDAMQSFTLTVQKTQQTINFPAIPTPQAALTPITLAATASSGLSVSFDSLTPTYCTVSGSTVTPILALGTCTVRAFQWGNSLYAPATTIYHSFWINHAPQTISFSAIAAQYVLTSVNLTATASSGLPVTYTTSTPTVCSISGDTVALLTPGSCSIEATQAGDTVYNPASAVFHSIWVNLAHQSITFPAIAAQYALTSVDLTATASSGLAITYTTSTPTVCSISGTTVSLLIGGGCSIEATQDGNSLYLAAPAVFHGIWVNLANQTISFPNPGPQSGVPSVNLSATASSGLAVSFASNTPTVCTVAGTTASLLIAGNCTIQATQPGTAAYNSAPAVNQSFTVTAP